jgi:hypothetical protein
VEAETEPVAADIEEQSLPVVEQVADEEQTSQDEESDDEYLPEEDGDSVYDEDSSNHEIYSDTGSVADDSEKSLPVPSTSKAQAAPVNSKTRPTVSRQYVKTTPKFPYGPDAEWDVIFSDFPIEFIEHVYRQRRGKYISKIPIKASIKNKIQTEKLVNV